MTIIDIIHEEIETFLGKMEYCLKEDNLRGFQLWHDLYNSSIVHLNEKGCKPKTTQVKRENELYEQFREKYLENKRNQGYIW